jgi:parvulin-like peptidyl-prolyl isomerase
MAIGRSGLGQIFVGVIVALIIGAFALSGGSQGPLLPTSECAVQVGKHCVDPKEYYAAYGLMSSIGLNDKAAKQLQLRMQIAQGLAERELLLDEAERLGISVSEEEVDDELAEGRTRVSLPAASAERLALSLAMCVEGPGGCAPGTFGLRALPVKKDGQLDYERYKKMVKIASGRSPAQFKEMQKREITAERVRDLIRSGVRVSEQEAFLAFARARSKATVRTVTAQPEWFARYVVSLSPEQVKAWDDAHKADVDAAAKALAEQWKAGCPVVSEVFVSVDPAASEEDKKAKRDAIDAAKKRLGSGDDFAKVARSVSEAESAVLGGDVGCLNEGYGPGAEALLKAVGELKEGDTSAVIESVRGFHVVKLRGKLTDADREARARSYAAAQLASRAEAQSAATRFARELSDKARGGKSLEEATTELARTTAEAGPLPTPKDKDAVHPALASHLVPKVEISRPFSIDQSPLSTTKPEQDAAAIAFGLQKDGDLAPEPLDTVSGVAVLQLKSKEMADKKSFDEEKAVLLEQFRSRKADDALTAYIERLRDKAGTIKFDPKHVPTDDAKSPAGPAKG